MWKMEYRHADTIHIGNAKFGTVVGGAGPWLGLRVMVIGSDGPEQAWGFVLVQPTTNPKQTPSTTVQSFSGDGWYVYEMVG